MWDKLHIVFSLEKEGQWNGKTIVFAWMYYDGLHPIWFCLLIFDTTILIAFCRSSSILLGRLKAIYRDHFHTFMHLILMDGRFQFQQSINLSLSLLLCHLRSKWQLGKSHSLGRLHINGVVGQLVVQFCIFCTQLFTFSHGWLPNYIWIHADFMSFILFYADFWSRLSLISVQ